MSVTPTSAHAASAKKIANYTQSISSGVTNLLTEIGRVSASTSAPASTTGTDGAILLQLQALTGQIVGLANRMEEVQRLVQGLEKRLDDLTCGPCDTGRELENDMHGFDSEKHNALARFHNGRTRNAHSILIPLHNSRGHPILGFPSNLSQLARLDKSVRDHLCKAYGVNNEPEEAFCEFVGVKPNTILELMLYGDPPEKLALDRIRRTTKREADCRDAGPPTPETRKAAEIHNRIARAHNKRVPKLIARDHNNPVPDSSDAPIMPIHDSRNIPVTGFPKTLRGLTTPQYQENILYFLEEYEQSVAPEGCIERWFEFTGVPVDLAMEDLDCEQWFIYTWLD